VLPNFKHYYKTNMRTVTIRKGLLRLIVLGLTLYSSIAFKVEEEEEEEEDSGEDTTQHRKETALVLVTIFIAFGICGEKALDYLEENTPEDLKPIQNAMLTEMTLMGMIGIVTFVLGKLKALNNPSSHILGEEDAINEMLEKVHMLLFFILVIFLAEASFLMFISKKRVNKWKEWNEIAKDDKKLKRMLNQHATDMADGKKVDHEKLIFLAIRQRFVFHKKAHENYKTPLDFEFHRYLGSCAGKTIGHLVEIDIKNWGALWGLFVMFWGLHWSLKGNRTVYIVGVSMIPLILAILNLIILLKTSRVKEGIAPSQYLQVAKKHAMLISRRRSSQLSLDGGKSSTQRDPEIGESSKLSDPLLDSKESVEDDDDDETLPKLPDPTNLIPKFSHRPLLSCFGRHIEGDDHTDLMWFNEGGEDFLREAIRMNLLMMAVFVAYCVTIFVPNTLYGSHHDDVSDGLKIFSIVMLILPSLLFFYMTPEVVLTFVTITSVESLKHMHFVSKVKRSMATAKAVKALKLLRSLMHSNKKKPKGGSSPKRKESSEAQGKKKAASERWLEENRKFLQDMFDQFDEDKSGTISAVELRDLLVKNRLVDTDHTVDDVIRTIDEDGSGEVCFAEFSAWVASGHFDSEDIEEVVDGLFSMIDIDGDGFLTHEEFKTALQSHAKDLTDSDISALINECDEDQDGQIDKEEFSNLLKMYSRNF